MQDRENIDGHDKFAEREIFGSRNSNIMYSCNSDLFCDLYLQSTVPHLTLIVRVRGLPNGKTGVVLNTADITIEKIRLFLSFPLFNR